MSPFDLLDTKTMSDGYVPRSQRYNHLLDSAYDDIRKTCRDDFVEEVPASPNLHQEPPTPAVSDEDREVEEDDATTFMQKHAEKVLRATVSDQQKTGYLFRHQPSAFYYLKWNTACSLFTAHCL